MSKKIVSLILAAMLTASMVGTAAISVAAQTTPGNYFTNPDGVETKKVYFLMPESWVNEFTNTAGAYWWEGSNPCPAWDSMYELNKVSGNVFSIDVPTDVVKVIFTNFLDGGEDKEAPIYTAATQTVDITINDDGLIYDTDECPIYPDGLSADDVANKIYVVDPNKIVENPFNGKLTSGGEWYYYYGDGKYGVGADKAKADAAGVTRDVVENELYDFEEAVKDFEKYNNTDEPVSSTATEPVTEAQPNVTVYATSNFFPTAQVEYYEVPGKVTVDYYLDANSSLVNFQWNLNYDSSVLILDDTNKKAKVMPQIGSDYILNTGLTNAAAGNGSSLSLYDVKGDAPFVSFTFDVVGEGETTVNLDVKTITFGKLDPSTESLDLDSKTTIVSGSKVIDENASKFEINNRTVITPPTNKPTQPETTVAPTDAPATTVAPTDAPATTVAPTDAPSSTGAPVTTAPASTTTTTSTNTNTTTNSNTVATGEASLAIVILGVLVASTGVMFVLRKKEMF